jgi:dethiobiotin synthetase
LIPADVVPPMIFFVAGIDTGIGKTIATGRLAAWFQRQGRRTITHKLVQTGNQGISDDIRVHRDLMGIELQPEDRQQLTCPAIYPFPASPHLAAELAGKPVDVAQIIASATQLAADYDVVLVEGAGGLLVPLTHQTTTIDVIARQSWPVILVSAPRLGSINHTLLSLEAIHSRGIELAAVVYNLHHTAAPEIVADTRQVILEAIARMGSRAPVIDMPGKMDGNTPRIWDDAALHWLLQEPEGRLSSLPEC